MGILKKNSNLKTPGLSIGKCPRSVRVAVAMSGGVDSGVAAALVVKAGFRCTGFHMHLWMENQKSKIKDQKFENKCCSTESLEAARKTAHQLEMPFYIVDFKDIFKRKIVDYFLEGYAKGLTPNPCVMCNRFVKFGELLRYVRKLGFDYLATGHYARIIDDCDNTLFAPGEFAPDTLAQSGLTSRFAHKGCLHLFMGRDNLKDQSYFLYNLTQVQLAHILFPGGDYLKKEVVEMAKKWKLPVAQRPESQEICFFPERDYRPFLKRHIINSIKPGEVVDTKGRVIGQHQGLPLYTIGQRRKFKVQSSKFKVMPPYYVIAKDIERNRLIVGFGKEAEKKEFWVKDVNWINRLVVEQLNKRAVKCFVRIRHQGKLLSCRVQAASGNGVRVVLEEPERGVAPGQAAVFYKGEEVLGGGIIALRRSDRHKLEQKFKKNKKEGCPLGQQVL